ncbi:hypothetical protein KR059_002348, partial [Drosophila kikkawai]
LNSCLVVLFETLVWTARAEGDFDSQRARVIEIYGNPATDQTTRERNVELLANFFDKYTDQILLPPELRNRVNDAVTKYKEEKAKQSLVEGTPAQGGVLLTLLAGFLVQVGIEAAYQGIKKAVS